ncbi:hypothetical protein HBI60_189480 [Parastagonospora nodorum]|nr:hypothetical protein HBI60_189480 [Parastagonospora nodorum]
MLLPSELGEKEFLSAFFTKFAQLSNPKMHVLLVGAGLDGLSLAQNLRKRGISFEIFERESEANARWQGWAITLHSIVDAAVDSYPSNMPDLRDSVNHLTPLQLPAQVTVYAPGKEGRFSFQDSPDSPLIRAESQRLRTWLSTNVPVQWDNHTDSISEDDEGVSLSFKDGTTARGDIVVGADGINSVVRSNLIKRPAKDLQNVIPVATTIGELDLSGEEFKRQLALGNSGITCMQPDLGFVSFVGLHFVHPDGLSARYYWNLMEYDSDVAKPDHWMKTATKKEKLDHGLKITEKLPPKLREIFELTKPEQIREEQHVWRDLEIESLPAGRVVLMGDAAHAMMPIRGEGGYHALVDSLVLGETLGQLAERDTFKDLDDVKRITAEYNDSLIQRGLQAVRDSRRLYLDVTRYGPDGRSLGAKEVPTTKPCQT